MRSAWESNPITASTVSPRASKARSYTGTRNALRIKIGVGLDGVEPSVCAFDGIALLARATPALRVPFPPQPRKQHRPDAYTSGFVLLGRQYARIWGVGKCFTRHPHSLGDLAPNRIGFCLPSVLSLAGFVVHSL